jgi:hypothetical protein
MPGRVSLVPLATALAFAAVASPLGCGSRTGIPLLDVAGNDAGNGSSSGSGGGGSSSGSSSGGAIDSGVAEAGDCRTAPGLVTLAAQDNIDYRTGPVVPDGTNVYWGTATVSGIGLPAVVKVPLCGGTPTTVAAGSTGPGGIRALTANASTAFWIEGPDTGPSLAVRSAPLSGGIAATMIASVVGGWNGMAFNASNLCFADYDQVLEVPLGGGAAQTLASGQPVLSVAMDASNLYWTSTDGLLKKEALGGGAVTTLATGAASGGVGAMTVLGSNVYWQSDPGILVTPVGGGATTTLVASTDNIGTFVMDDANVYWTDDLDRLQRISIHGGAATTLAVGNNMAGIAVDATSVYWTTVATCTLPDGTPPCSGASVMRLTPK